MKGQLSTRFFLKGILSQKTQLVHPQHPLTQIGLFLIPTYSKILLASDAGILIQPNLEEKKKVIENAVMLARQLRIPRPKVALIAPVEKVNPAIPATTDAAKLVRFFRESSHCPAEVEGPYDIYIATNHQRARQKGVQGKTVGNADILIFPELTSANVFYKTLMNFVPGAIAASLVGGSRCPILLPSRSDSLENRFFSLILAAFLSPPTPLK